MAPDRGVLARELAILAAVNRQSDPVLASVVAALYLEDATGVVLSDSQIARALSDPGAIDWVMPKGEQGS